MLNFDSLAHCCRVLRPYTSNPQNRDMITTDANDKARRPKYREAAVERGAKGVEQKGIGKGWHKDVHNPWPNIFSSVPLIRIDATYVAS